MLADQAFMLEGVCSVDRLRLWEKVLVQGQQGSVAAEWRGNWKVVLPAAAAMSLASTLNSCLGVVIEPMERELGWTRATISSVLLLISVSNITLATIGGIAIDRFGARRIGLLVLILMTGSIGLMSTMTNNIWHWWMLWGVFALGAAATPTVWLTPISVAFVHGRGMAIAVVLSGTGLSAALVPTIANYFAEHFGWRSAFLGLALIWGVLTLPLVMFLFRGPGTGPRSSGAKAGAHGHSAGTAKGVALPGFTAGEGFRSLTFYLIMIGAFVSAMATIALVVNMVPILTFTGLSRTEAAAVAGLLGIASLSGRLLGGWIIDRWNAAYLIVAASLGGALLPVVLLVAPGSVAMTSGGVLLCGTLIGMMMPAIFYLVSRHMGARAFGTFSGAVATTMALGAGLAPVVANHIFDVTRSYDPVFWAVIPCFAMSALLFSRLSRFPDFSHRFSHR